MNSEDETLKQPNKDDAVLRAIAELSGMIAELSGKVDKLEGKIDKLEGKTDGVQGEFNAFKNETNAQFGVIREGIVYNSVAFDRLQPSVFLLSANVKELGEEVWRNNKVLI
ncbi:MAG TPA: hypothetical protein PKE69_21405 [Pyrinomonadaceae bacterium]|nr:hypothetical protein [Pyrinomonadaceae bacterium]